MLRNTTLKIISVALAIILWLVVVSGQVETVNMSVPINLVNAQKGNVAISSVNNVSVSVKGSAKLMSAIKYSSVILNVNVENYPQGDTLYRIMPDDFITPIGTEVVEVIPETVTITLDSVASKRLKVTPTFIAEVKRGFKVESVAVTPNYVEVEGAKSKLRLIENIATLPLNLSDRQDSSLTSIGFRIEDGVKSIKPEVVDVRIKLKPDIIRKDFKRVPVSCLGLQKGLELSSTTPYLNNVKVSGRSDLVDIFLDDTTFMVNCSEIKTAGKYTGNVVYKSKIDEVQVLSILPEKIKFEVVNEKVLRN